MADHKDSQDVVVDHKDSQDVVPPKRICRICKLKLKRFTSTEDWDSRAYHKKCYDDLINDISHYNTRAYTKYNHKKRMIDGTLLDERRESKSPITVTFD